MNIDMDAVDLAVMEEALCAADALAKRLEFSQSSPVYTNFVVLCGVAFKELLTQDSPMGLKAQQTLLRGFIERTAISTAHFITLKEQFLQFVDNNGPSDLGSALKMIDEKDNQRLCAIIQNHWSTSGVQEDSLQGPWREEYSALQFVHNLALCLSRLEDVVRYSYDADMKKYGYKTHTPSANASYDTQLKAVAATLGSGNDTHYKTDFEKALKSLHTHNTQVAQFMLHQFYILGGNKGLAYDNRAEIVNKAKADLVSVDQSNYWKWIQLHLDEQLGQADTPSVMAKIWVDSVVARAQEVISQWEPVVMIEAKTEVEPVGKEAIEQHRAQAKDALRERLKIA